MSVIESWIVEDPEKDKSSLYGLNAVKGAWAVTMKIDNNSVWNDVKNGKYLGLSIEGIFSDKDQQNFSKDLDEITEEEAIMALQEIKKYLEDEGEIL